MLEIQTGVFIGIKFNNIEYNLEQAAFSKLIIVSNKRTYIPSFQLDIYDIRGTLDTNTLVDGTLVTIHVGRSASHFDTYEFRLYKLVKNPSPSTPSYTLLGYLNFPKWFMQTLTAPINGTSSDVLKQLAEMSGLKHELDMTSDSMTWLPTNKTICAFARYVGWRGYIDERSSMSLGLTLDGCLRYKNLTLLPKDGQLFTFGGAPNAITVLDARAINNSGQANLTGGYNHATLPQTVEAVSDRKTRDKVDVKRQGQSLQINKSLKNSVEKGRVDVGLVNGGNTHANWEHALYQNLRIAGTYTNGVELLIDTMTDKSLDVLSTILYEAYQQPSTGLNTIDQKQRGSFVVTAKVIYIDQGNYFQKFQAYSNAINADTSKSLL